MRHKLLILFLLLNAALFAQVISRPQPPRLVNIVPSLKGFLSPSEEQQLEEKLEAFSNETSNQILVVVVDNLNGLSAEQYATQIGNTWGVGQKSANNGIVILLQPTGGEGQRDYFIAVGYGLEGAIPDLATKRIREQEMLPYLKKGDYYGALNAGCDVLMQLAKGEINVKNYTRKSSKNNTAPSIIIIIVIGIIVFSALGRGNGGNRGGGGGFTYWGGGWGGGGFGGGSSGGGGGGFGGFGGGSFGGGGSGGKW